MAIALAVVAVIAIAIGIQLQGPDRTVMGTASVVEDHRLCVTDASGTEQCAHVDEPDRVADIRVGDCLRVRRSGSGILETVESAAGCG